MFTSPFTYLSTGAEMGLQSCHELRQGAGSLYLSSVNFETRATSRLLPLAEGISQKESQLWAVSSQPSCWLREWASQSGMGSEWVHHTCQIPFYFHKMCAHPELEITGSSSLFNIVLVFDSQSSNSDVQEIAYSYDLWCYLISIPSLHPARIYWKCNVNHAWGFLPKSGLFAGSRPRLEGGRAEEEGGTGDGYLQYDHSGCL